jgi:hypothetical protein
MWTEYRQVGQDNRNFYWYSEVQRHRNGTPFDISYPEAGKVN